MVTEPEGAGFTAPLDALQHSFGASIREIAQAARDSIHRKDDGWRPQVEEFLHVYAEQVLQMAGGSPFETATVRYRRAADTLYDNERLPPGELRPLFRIRAESMGVSRNLPPEFESTVSLLYARQALAIDPFWWASSPWSHNLVGLPSRTERDGALHLDGLPFREWWCRILEALARMEPAIRRQLVSFVPVDAPARADGDTIMGIPHSVITDELQSHSAFRNTWDDRRSLLLEAETIIAAAHSSTARITPLFHVPALRECVDWLIRNQLRTSRPQGTGRARKRPPKGIPGQLGLPGVDTSGQAHAFRRNVPREETGLQDLCRLELPGIDHVAYRDLVAIRDDDSFSVFRDHLVHALNHAVGLSPASARKEVGMHMAAAARELRNEIQRSTALSGMFLPATINLAVGAVSTAAAIGWQDVLPLAGVGAAGKAAELTVDSVQKKRRRRRLPPRHNLYMALSYLSGPPTDPVGRS